MCLVLDLHHFSVSLAAQGSCQGTARLALALAMISALPQQVTPKFARALTPSKPLLRDVQEPSRHRIVAAPGDIVVLILFELPRLAVT